MTDYPTQLIARDGQVLCPMCSKPVEQYTSEGIDEVLYVTDPREEWAAAHGAAPWSLRSTRSKFMTYLYTFQPCGHEWRRAARS